MVSRSVNLPGRGSVGAAVDVTFLGCGDAFGSGGRFQTCMHLRSDGASEGSNPTRLLVDCGASSLVAMKRSGLGTSDVDAVLLSHLHGDHFGGIPFFIMDAHYVAGREKPLVVAGPPGVEARVMRAMEVLFPGTSQTPRPFAVEFVEMGEGTPTKIGPVSVTPYGVVHPSGAPSYALRIELHDKILAFSGDTEWTEALLRVSRGADLFVCECTLLHKGVPYLAQPRLW